MAVRYELKKTTISRIVKFMEFDNCRAKLGLPVLCASCINNREIIYKFYNVLKNIANTQPHFAGQTRNEYFFQKQAKEVLTKYE